ncbi:cytochrome c oxidase subunit 7A2, mitochondrial-like [Leptinotarsa decemlineata]|uniref:cytochrome c oxidase subunit 7A2, mitochondrial-like n=1 Tax=Leptinotarsa decemlineata TaxID=7539 RepID=UPI003D30608B
MASKLLNLGRIQAQVSIRGMNPRQPRRFLSADLKKKQEHFQRNPEIPVYLKGGFGDKFLAQLTAVLTAIGLADGLYTVLQFAHPKKG